jgi:hypothetical protein
MGRTGARVESLVLSSDGVGEADARVYDGHSADAKKYVQLYCVDEAQQQLKFNPPLVFDKGIYVDIGTNVDTVLIEYEPLPQ